MEALKEHARELLSEFKGGRYVHGLGCLAEAGRLAREVGRRAALVRPHSRSQRSDNVTRTVAAALAEAGVEVAGEPICGAAPNTPREDVYRIEGHLLHPAVAGAEAVVVIGGGSNIDAAKAAAALASFGEASAEIEDYFGVGKVSAAAQACGRAMLPILAVQTASASAAHLTKYSNVTDLAAGQKKLIVDERIVPARALFDYRTTTEMPRDFTYDGAMDGVCHLLEVYYGAKGEQYAKVEEIALTGIELIVTNLEAALSDGSDEGAREALGLGTDLGGYAIMTGSTNGAHLASFSLVDVTSHGRACGILNPYYTVFFAPAIERQLRALSEVFARAGLGVKGHGKLRGRALGEATAGAMIAFSRKLGFPTTLAELAAFTQGHIERALAAAKNPQFAMKLAAMPVPMEAGTVERYMRPVLAAASTGSFAGIQNV